MPRMLPLTRTEAEWLVDLLEDCDPKKTGTWRHDLASEIRTLFGMVSLEEEKKTCMKKKKNAKTYTKIAGKIKKVDFHKAEKPASFLPDAPPPEFHPGEDPMVQFKLGAERDAKIQREKDLEAGRLIYEAWKAKLINRRHTVGMIIEALSELINELDAAIKSDFKEYVINCIINPVIAHFHDSNIIKQYTMSVVVDCPKCEWGGRALFHKSIWEEGQAQMKCGNEECGTLLSQKNGDMITEEEGRKIAAQVRKDSK
jgi:hypothetical protein